MSQIVLVGYGVRTNDNVMLKFTIIPLPLHPVVDYMWDSGYQIYTPPIPMFISDKKYSTIYQLKNRRDAGSVEVKYSQNSGIVRCIVYQQLMHVLKALTNVDICVPRTNKSMRQKVTAWMKMFNELKKVKTG